MTPETLRIDLRFKGVGRINRASGTTDPAVVRRLKRMLRDLYEDGRLDILRAIRDGAVTFMQVYDAVRRRSLHELPIGDTMPLLNESLEAWIKSAKGEYSEDHLENLQTARRLFLAHFPEARVADLPRVLDELRKTYGASHARSFNLARAAATSFVRATLKRSHPLWLACTAVEPRKVKKRAPGRLLTPDDARALFKNPDTDKVDAIAWAMLVTGMGPKEYWGRWSTHEDRVHIAGTKRAGRVRDVPLIVAPAVPRLSRDRWRRVFGDRMTKAEMPITPYDLRRTYARWLELAEIPRARRRLYMGHGAKDVTDLYERSEVTRFLAEDGRKLRTFLGLGDEKSSPVPSPIAIVS